MAASGTDLSLYRWVDDRPGSKPLRPRQNRGVGPSIGKTFTSRWAGRVPNPVMLTHIVTTRCNYSCGFCSFADTLNSVSDI
ncbi:MAG: hypothetical protein R2857_09775 [Vampirovibrionales bacterium]